MSSIPGSDFFFFSYYLKLGPVFTRYGMSFHDAPGSLADSFVVAFWLWSPPGLIGGQGAT